MTTWFYNVHSSSCVALVEVPCQYGETRAGRFDKVVIPALDRGTKLRIRKYSRENGSKSLYAVLINILLELPYCAMPFGL